MDRADQKDCPACACVCSRAPTAPPYAAAAAAAPRRPGPTRGQRLLGAATVAAALLVGLNALVQALNVLATWLLRLG